MKLSLSLRLATLGTIVLTSFMPLSPGKAAGSFDEQDLEQTKVIAIARPYGENKYDLLVIEQIPNKRQCWNESGKSPILVNPLLLNFDFTGICRRSTDSNGYSIRVDGQDYGLDYLLRLVERNGELLLIGTPRTNTGQEIVIGRTGGISRDFMKINLDPGWRFTKRTFKGKTLGHFYFSNLPASKASPPPSPKPSPTPRPTTRPTPKKPSSSTKSLEG